MHTNAAYELVVEQTRTRRLRTPQDGGAEVQS